MSIFGGMRLYFTQDVFDDMGGCGSSTPPSPVPSRGPGHGQLMGGLSGAHKRARKACKSLIGPCLILSISFIVAAAIASFNLSGVMGGVLASTLWLSALVAILVAMFANHRAHLHHLSLEAAHNAQDIYRAETFSSIRNHLLLANLGLSSTSYNGDIITTAFYLGRDERDQSLGIVTFSRSLDDRRCFDQSMQLTDFISLVFENKKTKWVFSEDRFSLAYPGFCPQINSFVRDSLVEHLPVEAFASIKSMLNKDGVLLRALLQKRPYDLDLLPEIGETQLLVWCKQNIPQKGWRQWLYLKNASVDRLIRAMVASDILAKAIPAVLLERAVDYCLTPKGSAYLRSFSNWLWYVAPASPASLPKPEYTHIQNAWMLRTVSNASVFRSINTLYSKIPEYFDVYKDAVRKIIDSVGLDPDASMDDECYQGYRNLYGLEATLKRYPESSRILLQNDLNI